MAGTCFSTNFDSRFSQNEVGSKEKAMILLKNMSIAELIECLVSHLRRCQRAIPQASIGTT